MAPIAPIRWQPMAFCFFLAALILVITAIYAAIHQEYWALIVLVPAVLNVYSGVRIQRAHDKQMGRG